MSKTTDDILNKAKRLSIELHASLDGEPDENVEAA